MKRQGGFTLIELVVVIVILGILAVTAAPRFLNLQTDARNATLEGLKGAMQGAASIVYARAALDGKDPDINQLVSGAGSNIKTDRGYPEASTDGIGKAIENAENPNAEWLPVTGNMPNNYTIRYTFAGKESDYTSNCYVQYVMSEAVRSTPQISVVDCQ
ncbi:type II secretion system protein [Vibrio sonorensis]|uniref:type II secretion system protein n=1 Tax=Vibrio sonorensis TaxID=1004316 RepID=UPI0008DA39D2|nr:type II secretion system protein [Vibrio sonorensis]